MPTNSPESPEREREEQAADQRGRKKFRPDDGETGAGHEPRDRHGGGILAGPPSRPRVMVFERDPTGRS